MFLNYLFDKYDNISQTNIYQNKQIDNYWQHNTIKYSNQPIKDYSGNYVRPSMLNNVYGSNIQYLKRKKRENEIEENENSKIYTKDNLLDELIKEGQQISLAKNIHEQEGMKIIRNMMNCIKTITSINNITLEPFQLEAIRSLICSSGERLLGKDLCKYVPEILDTCGIYDDSTKGDTITRGKSFSQILHKNFSTYNKKIIAVIAPRRNGKSKVSKIFVTANAVCEIGSRIVLSAHRVEAILLYKNEIISYLKQLLQTKCFCFKIHSSEHEIRIEYPNKTESAIYFVPGGKDVSILFSIFL